MKLYGAHKLPTASAVKPKATTEDIVLWRQWKRTVISRDTSEMYDLRPKEKEEPGTKNDTAFRGRGGLWQVRPRPIFQSHLLHRLYTARYHIDWCIDLKQPALV